MNREELNQLIDDLDTLQTLFASYQNSTIAKIYLFLIEERDKLKP